MFQRSFTEDDDEDEAMLQAAVAWDDGETGTSSTRSGNVTESPSKKTIKDYFCK